jgi:hypothetical protein
MERDAGKDHRICQAYVAGHMGDGPRTTPSQQITLSTGGCTASSKPHDKGEIIVDVSGHVLVEGPGQCWWDRQAHRL